MMLPDLIMAPVINKHTLQLNFALSSELFWFRGHFPIQAIFPGVAQIEWVMHYAKEYFQITSFTGLDVVKFQRPLFPDDIIVLVIEWLPEKNKLKFQYSKNAIVASTGQISL